MSKLPGLQAGPDPEKGKSHPVGWPLHVLASLFQPVRARRTDNTILKESIADKRHIIKLKVQVKQQGRSRPYHL
jgi:hypothetical protein